jgi:hypothetical protein
LFIRVSPAGTGTDPATLDTVGRSLARSGLVPRRLAMLGLIGGPLICLTGILVVAGAIEPQGAVQTIATIPEFFWVLLLGLYLAVKGFRPSPVLR